MVKSHTDTHEGLEPSMHRAVIRIQGYCAISSFLHPETCVALLGDLQTSTDAATPMAGPSIRAVGFLQDSATALTLLDDPQLGVLVDELAGPDAILSRLDGVRGPQSAWTRDFKGIYDVLPPRAFRAGIAVWIALRPATAHVLVGSQNLENDIDQAAPWFTLAELSLPAGGLVVLEGGVRYRMPEGDEWLRLLFVRPWLKPDILFSTALTGDRLARLGERGRRWCGIDLGLPTSVESFLAIEEAALSGAVGRAKGSGV